MVTYSRTPHNRKGEAMNESEIAAPAAPWQGGIRLHTSDVAEGALSLRLGHAIHHRQALYPMRRRLRIAARDPLESLFDRLIKDPGWRGYRPEPNRVLLDANGLFVEGSGTTRSPHCSCVFHILAADESTAAAARARIMELLSPVLITEPAFTIEWHFVSSMGSHHHALIHELANDVLHDGAYPTLRGGVQAFIDAYLTAPESILVLQGPPGTGKTRLIRAILGAMARRQRDEETSAMFTGDERALTSDEFFVRFITGDSAALVIEDADHLLRPRSSGNESLHRFLTIADGVVRAQGRKIIFSTNLPNIGDLDDALLRPGRCFAHLQLRQLEPPEAEQLFALIRGNTGIDAGPPFTALSANARNYPLAEIYRAARVSHP